MPSVRSLAVVAALAVAAPVLALAAEVATTKDAEMMVRQAVAFLKKEGKEKAFAEFNNPAGRFTYRDLYVTVYDLKGACLAHGQKRERIGKNLLEEKDADGKQFVKERVKIAKEQGKGWQEYKFANPVTKKTEQKVAYFERVDDLIVLCGAYKSR
jgi:signal transduction histidine kinase